MSILLGDIQGHRLLVTLNRPDQLNALNYELVDALSEALDAAENDAAIRYIVITGAGKKAFSAGADIKQFAQSVAEGNRVAVQDFVRRGQRLTRQIENLTKPVIVAVNGLAYGGGCEITEAAHVAVASDSARFAKSEIQLSMPPTFGGTQRLPRNIGRKKAFEMLLTGDSFSAGDALIFGLVNRVVPQSDLLETAFGIGERIAQHSPEAVAAILTATTRGLNMPIDEGLRVEREQFAQLVGGHALTRGLNRWIRRSR